MRPPAGTNVGRWALAILAATTMWWSPGTLQALSAAELVMFEARACPWCAAWDDEVGLIYGSRVLKIKITYATEVTTDIK